MNQPPLPPKVDHPLDRRIALAVLAAVLLILPIATPLIWQEISGRYFEGTKVLPPGDLVTAWLLVCCTCIGFYAALAPGMSAMRFAVSLGACQWVFIVYEAAESLGAATFGVEMGNWLIITLTSAEIAIGLATFRWLTGCRLGWRGMPVAASARRGQFRLQDLMLLTLVAGIIMGTFQLTPSLSFQSLWAFVGWRIWIDLFIPVTVFAALAVSCILLAFSRISVFVFLITTIAIALVDAVQFLAIYIPVSRWADVAARTTAGAFLLKFVFVIGCTGTMLVIRWIGYQLQTGETARAK